MCKSAKTPARALLLKRSTSSLFFAQKILIIRGGYVLGGGLKVRPAIYPSPATPANWLAFRRVHSRHC